MDIRTQEDRITLTTQTWEHDVNARRADVRVGRRGCPQIRRDARIPGQHRRQHGEAADEAAPTRPGAQHARAAKAMPGAPRPREGIAVARHTPIRCTRSASDRPAGGLEVKGKYVVRAPSVATVVQSQLIWPGELAQPGAPVVAVLDPADKYVQVYVPVADVDEFRLGRRVEIELDSEPGRRIPGEVSFVADQANFTPEKIETRSDRLGQVYRVKVRVLERVAELKPGTEGNVYIVEGGAKRDSATADNEDRASP
jgi:hypothetical protein